MSSKAESLKRFKSKTDELIISNYILADKKISDVLKTIASSRLLYEIFEYVTEGFDYETCKSVCFSETADGECKFSIPKKSNDLLAFCFLLLYEIDTKKVDLLKLCNKYFNTGNGSQQNYNLFTTELLLPFEILTEQTALKIINGNGVFNGKDSEVAKKEESKKVERLETVDSVKPENSYIDYLLNGIKDGTLFKKDEEKEQVEYILEQLKLGLKENDVDRITLAFTAIRYFSEGSKKPVIDVSRLAEEITESVQ